MIINFKNLATGASFYLPQFPDSLYRKHAPGVAEIVISRIDGSFNGSLLKMFGHDRPVATSKEDTKDQITCWCGMPVGEPYEEGICNRCRRELNPVTQCQCCGEPVPSGTELCGSCSNSFYTTTESELEGLDLL